MKKITYTLAFVALFSLTNKAQTLQTSPSADQKPMTKEQVNADGTLKVEENTEKKPEVKPADKPATRMAISEKGVPTSKPKPTSKTAAPTNKEAKPGTQSTEKK